MFYAYICVSIRRTNDTTMDRTWEVLTTSFLDSATYVWFVCKETMAPCNHVETTQSHVIDNGNVMNTSMNDQFNNIIYILYLNNEIASPLAL